MTPETSEKIYEVEDVLEAFDGLQKAARSDFIANFIALPRAIQGWALSSVFACRILENHQREQKEHCQSQVEGLRLKVDHLQKESSKLQNLFQEKSNINESILQEVSRLSSENAVRRSTRLCATDCDRTGFHVFPVTHR